MEFVKNYNGNAIFTKPLKNEKTLKLFQVVELKFYSTKYLFICENIKQVENCIDELNA